MRRHRRPAAWRSQPMSSHWAPIRAYSPTQHGGPTTLTYVERTVYNRTGRMVVLAFARKSDARTWRTGRSYTRPAFARSVVVRARLT